MEFFRAFETWAANAGAKAPTVRQRELATHVQWLVSHCKGTVGSDGVMRVSEVSDVELSSLVQHYECLRDVRNYAAHFDKTEKFDLTYAGAVIGLLAVARYLVTLHQR